MKILSKQFLPLTINVVTISAIILIWWYSGFSKIVDSLTERTTICFFAANTGITMIGFIMAIKAIIMTLDGRVFFERYKENGGYSFFSTTSLVTIILFFILLLLSLLGIKYDIPYYGTYIIFVTCFFNVLILIFVTFNLTSKSTVHDTRDPKDQLELISDQLREIKKYLKEIATK